MTAAPPFFKFSLSERLGVHQLRQMWVMTYRSVSAVADCESESFCAELLLHKNLVFCTKTPCPEHLFVQSHLLTRKAPRPQRFMGSLSITIFISRSCCCRQSAAGTRVASERRCAR